MTVSTEIRQRAIALLEKLLESMLDEAVQLLESLRVKADAVREVAVSKLPESALLEIIHRRLPADEQARLDYLRDQNEYGELSDDEYQELLTYEEQMENKNVERLRALMELAKHRNTDLATLNSELKVQKV
jgi:hypothetical protein